MLKKLFLLAVILSPCFLNAQTTETRKLSSFNRLKAGGSFQTIIEQGNEETARIEAEGIDTKKIITEVQNNTLKLRLENGNYRNIKVTVFITYKSLSSVSQSGSGKLTCNSDLDAKEFELGSSGSGGLIVKGKIKAQKVDIGVSGSGGAEVNAVEAEDLEISVSGSGGLVISNGKVKNEDIEVAGSGSIRAFGVSAGNASISIAGSGSVDLSVETSIKGRIAGSGNINYKGNANILSSSTAGSGRIRKV